MFSANPSISPIRLKPLDVAKKRENKIGRGQEHGRTEGWTGRSDGGSD